ncbi:MAG: hypothetical protein LRY73_19980 [Bacillus sp. (in: Bacteria)]|nr:hypothetical protein [Bacillus sp. (in: firmicutes)]
MPSIIITLAWVFVGIRCGLKFFHLISSRSKDWLEILFYLSVTLIASQ